MDKDITKVGVSLTVGLILGVIFGAAVQSGKAEASCERRLWAQKEAFWQERNKQPTLDDQIKQFRELFDTKPVWEPHP